MEEEDIWLVPGLSPMRTMVTAFAREVNYRFYRLRETRWEISRTEFIDMFHLKLQIDGLHPSLHAYSGVKPIGLLTFLATMKNTINTLGVSEAAANAL